METFGLIIIILCVLGLILGHADYILGFIILGPIVWFIGLWIFRIVVLVALFLPDNVKDNFAVVGWIALVLIALLTVLGLWQMNHDARIELNPEYKAMCEKREEEAEYKRLNPEPPKNVSFKTFSIFLLSMVGFLTYVIKVSG